MSIYPSPDILDNMPLERPSKYALVIMAAKRARQVKDSARTLVETTSANPLTVALEEIAAGQIIPRRVEDKTVNAYQAALKPSEPSMEDIISAGPVLVLDGEGDSTFEVLRGTDGEMEDGHDPDDIATMDAFSALATPGLAASLEHDHDDDDDDRDRRND